MTYKRRIRTRNNRRTGKRRRTKRTRRTKKSKRSKRTRITKKSKRSRRSKKGKSQKKETAVERMTRRRQGSIEEPVAPTGKVQPARGRALSLPKNVRKNCKFGDRCTRRNCWFLHPRDDDSTEIEPPVVDQSIIKWHETGKYNPKYRVTLCTTPTCYRGDRCIAAHIKTDIRKEPVGGQLAEWDRIYKTKLVGTNFTQPQKKKYIHYIERQRDTLIAEATRDEGLPAFIAEAMSEIELPAVTEAYNPHAFFAGRERRGAAAWAATAAAASSIYITDEIIEKALRHAGIELPHGPEPEPELLGAPGPPLEPPPSVKKYLPRALRDPDAREKMVEMVVAATDAGKAEMKIEEKMEEAERGWGGSHELMTTTLPWSNLKYPDIDLDTSHLPRESPIMSFDCEMVYIKSSVDEFIEAETPGEPLTKKYFMKREGNWISICNYEISEDGAHQIQIEEWEHGVGMLVPGEEWLDLDDITLSYQVLARVTVVDGSLLQYIDIYVDFLSLPPSEQEEGPYREEREEASKKLNTWQAWCKSNPGDKFSDVSDWVTNSSGISPELYGNNELENKLKKKEYVVYVMESLFIQKDTIVGHALANDISILVKDLGLDLPSMDDAVANRYYDTQVKVRQIWDRNGLKDITYYLGKRVPIIDEPILRVQVGEGGHDSLEDAFVPLLLYLQYQAMEIMEDRLLDIDRLEDPILKHILEAIIEAGVDTKLEFTLDWEDATNVTIVEVATKAGAEVEAPLLEPEPAGGGVPGLYQVSSEEAFRMLQAQQVQMQELRIYYDRVLTKEQFMQERGNILGSQGYDYNTMVWIVEQEWNALPILRQ